MQAVILATGEGARRQPITLSRSKAILPILGKPIVGWMMELRHTNGVDDFALVVSSEDRDITHHCLREATFPAEVRFVYQTECLMTFWQTEPQPNALLLLMPVTRESISSTGITALDGSGSRASSRNRRQKKHLQTSPACCSTSFAAYSGVFVQNCPLTARRI